MNYAGLTVRDCMTTALVTVAPAEDLVRVVNRMVEAGISLLLVVESDDQLVGIVTERDCIGAAPAASYYGEPGGPVSKIMSTRLETLAPDDSLVDVAVQMSASPHRGFPVVEEGRLVGLLTRRDVLSALNRGAAGDDSAGG